MSVYLASSESETCRDMSFGLVKLTEEQEAKVLAEEKGYNGAYGVKIISEYDDDDEEIPHWSEEVEWITTYPHACVIKGVIRFIGE